MTIVNINPSSQTACISGTTAITIDCTPSEPIKAFELNVSFNQNILQATSVQAGTIFEGFQTFFNPGTINNTSGSILDIYNLTIGSGNTTDSPGSLVKILFFNKDSGNSPIQLNGVMVLNETEIIPSTIENGNVFVYNVQVTDSENITIQVIHP